MTSDAENNSEAILEKTAINMLKAVSYTHLRAHETVLDLVCRLLLEKKNIHLKTTHDHVLSITQ